MVITEYKQNFKRFGCRYSNRGLICSFSNQFCWNKKKRFAFEAIQNGIEFIELDENQRKWHYRRDKWLSNRKSLVFHGPRHVTLSDHSWSFHKAECSFHKAECSIGEMRKINWRIDKQIPFPYFGCRHKLRCTLHEHINNNKQNVQVHIFSKTRNTILTIISTNHNEISNVDRIYSFISGT